MTRKNRPLDRQERRENALRPNRLLGYDRDDLGMYFIQAGEYRLAEMQLRRAVWLNPFEPRFKAHLGLCIFRMGNAEAARRWVDEALQSAASDAQVRRIEGIVNGRPRRTSP